LPEYVPDTNVGNIAYKLLTTGKIRVLVITFIIDCQKQTALKSPYNANYRRWHNAQKTALTHS